MRYALPAQLAQCSPRQAYGVLLWAWLGGYKPDGGIAKPGRLLTIDEVGSVLKSEPARGAELD